MGPTVMENPFTVQCRIALKNVHVVLIPRSTADGVKTSTVEVVLSSALALVPAMRHHTFTCRVVIMIHSLFELRCVNVMVVRASGRIRLRACFFLRFPFSCFFFQEEVGAQFESFTHLFCLCA